MRRTPWFERRFAAIDDNGLLPGILERLEARLLACDRYLLAWTARPPLSIPGGALRRRSDTS
jgi:hypothetical protein